MNFAVFVPVFVIFIIIFVCERNSKIAVRNIIKSKKGRNKAKMYELAKGFIDKECIVYTFNSQQLTGVIKEIRDGAILLATENGASSEIINLDYVVRIREYPKNKKGKKRSVVLD